MDVEKVVDNIGKSYDRLVKAVELHRRDEKWWAALAKEDWTLIQLAWQLRGVILKRGQLDDKARKQLEELLKDSDAM